MSETFNQLRAGLGARSTQFKRWNKERLESPGEIEYLFVSIYRVDFATKNRKKLMREIIFHIGDPESTKTKVKKINRFSTFTNNRILGLEVQNASVYGSKIQLAFDDFDKKLSRTIKKNDVIIIHRLNQKKLKQIDAIASVMGLATASPSGIREPILLGGIANKAKEKLTGIAGLDTLIDRFLTNEEPIFSGLITNPQLIMSNSIKLTIEAQDMIRIMQHINTEDNQTAEVKGIPKSLDDFIINLGLSDELELEIKGEDNVKILTSYILNTLSEAVMQDLKSHRNVTSAKEAFYKFLKPNEKLSNVTTQHEFFNDRIFIKPISNSMYLIHVSPIKAIKLFTKYYAQRTGINVFFKMNTWDTDFFQDRSVVEKIYEKIYKNSIGINPYFTFGIVLNIPSSAEERAVVPYRDDVVKTRAVSRIFKLLKDYELQYTFTEKTFEIFRKHRITESVVLKYVNRELEEQSYEKVISQFFLNIVRPTEVDPNAMSTTAILEDGNELFKTNDKSFVISSKGRQLYNDKIEEIKTEFDHSLSLSYIVNVNFSSVRSVEYNPILSNQMKSVPITQVIQLFLGGMTTIPVSQSQKTTGFDNTAHNISQRIWLKSAIGFSNGRIENSRASWIWDEGSKLIPTIFFGLNYEPAYQEGSDSAISSTYVSDQDLINAEMYTLPSNGALSIYNWISEKIQLGFSKYNEGEDKTLLSLGMTNSFDLEDIAGSIKTYVTENTDPQETDGTPQNFPRIGTFVLNGRLDQTQNTHASTGLRRFDAFSMIAEGNRTPYPIYLGYDLYAMKGEGITLQLVQPQDLVLHLPYFDGTTAKLFEADGEELLKFGLNALNSDDLSLNEIFHADTNDFPEDNSIKIGKDAKRIIVTGIQTYYDPTKFIPILQSYLHFIEHGFTGVNGEGDKDWYDSNEVFEIFHNLKFEGKYLTSFELRNPAGRLLPAKTLTIKGMITKLLKWTKQFVGNEQKKRMMMVKYAKDIAGIKLSSVYGEGAPVFVVNEKTHFYPPSLLSKIEIVKDIPNPKAITSIAILTSVVRGLAHYMNRVTKESTTGGVLYMPIKHKRDGKIFKIGDAITFQDTEEITVDKLKNILTQVITLGANNPKTSLDLYKKTYYVWKITYYFGGAGTDPSGTSGNTMRVYLTDSGIHWQSSFEEKDITTRVAEKMQLHRLAVGV